MNVGIVGGGVLGLSVAYELAKEGHKVSIFERAPFVGGQASTFEVGGGKLERAYHHLFVSDRDIQDLAQELGIGDRLIWVQSKVGIFANGRIWDFVTPKDLLKFKPLSLLNRIRLGLATLYIKHHKDWRQLEKVTASQWLAKAVGRKAYEVVWEPLLRGKFGTYYQDVAMSWFWSKIQLRFGSRGKGIRGLQRERLGYPRGSFEIIFSEVIKRITDLGGEIHLSANVQEVLVKDNKATGLKVQLADGTTEDRAFDVVIATTPSFVLWRIVPNLPDEYVKKLQSVRYLAAVLAILVLDRPLSHIYWLNIADRSIPFLGVIEQTNLVDPSFYGGNHIVYLSNYLSNENPLYSATKEQLLEAYLPHLKKLNPLFEESWIKEYHYHREEAAQPVTVTNYSEYMPDHDTPVENLFLGNTTQIYPEDRGTNYSVRLGRRLAAHILKKVASA